MPHSQLSRHFADGPARFIMARDGPKDYLALLVTEPFLNKLEDFVEQEKDLKARQISVTHAEIDIDNIENSTENAKDALEAARGYSEKEELNCYIEHQQPRITKLRQRKSELEKQCGDLKREIDRSTNYAHYVLKEAMESANLLRKRKDPSVRDVHSVEVKSPAQLASDTGAGTEPIREPEGMARHAAYEEVGERWRNLRKVQQLFDDRSHAYHDEVIIYQRRIEEGNNDCSRSEVDRRYVEYGRKLTRALIEAESSFEKAKERADALEFNAGYSASSDFLCQDDEEGELMAQYISSRNWSSIETWRATIPVSEAQEVMEIDILDDSDAGLVEISDSASARDGGEYRRRIDCWQRTRGVYEGPNRPWTKDIWTKDEGE